jgi:hypothetical protein
MLSDALEAPSAVERERGLQRLGDVSLFIAGFFAHSFARKLIDIDYHIAMGGRAYGTLACGLARGRRHVLGRYLPNWRPSSSRWSMRWARSAMRPGATPRRTSCGCTRSGSRPAVHAPAACCASSASKPTPGAVQN